jgi:CRP-like cAMP-binding protein
VLSAVTVMKNGTAIEAANIGNEGVFGSNAMFSLGNSPHRVIVQVEGEGLPVEIAPFRKEAERRDVLYELLLNYNSAFRTQVSQSVACNGLHSAYQRCCRWLLMSHDRVYRDEIPLTHEFLAIMLGVRRAGVSEVLRSLKQDELIDSHRGIITILDRKGLEGASCECYRAVTDEYGRLFARFPLRDR